MADTKTQHTGHAIVMHDSSWSGCQDCGRWIDTRQDAS
jgi:hypothetical protein